MPISRTMKIAVSAFKFKTKPFQTNVLDKILEEQTSKQEKMDKRHRKLNSELNEELIQRRVKMEDFESFLDEVIKKAEAKLNTFASPEKENRQTQTPETVKRKYPQLYIISEYLLSGYDRRKLDKALNNVRNSSRRLNFAASQTGTSSPGRIEKNSPKRSILPKPSLLTASLLSQEKPLESSTPNSSMQNTKPTQTTTSHEIIKPTKTKPVKPPKPQKLLQQNKSQKPIRQSAF